MKTIVDDVKAVLSLGGRLRHWAYALAAGIILVVDVALPVVTWGVKSYCAAHSQRTSGVETKDLSDTRRQDGYSHMTRLDRIFERIVPALERFSGSGDLGKGFSTGALAFILVALMEYLSKRERSGIVVHDKLEPCLDSVFSAVKGNVISLEIYAYSAKNYIANITKAIESGRIKRIKKIRLLLCRANEIRAWQSHGQDAVKKYFAQIQSTIETFETWESKKLIDSSNWEIRYVDDRPLCHFCIINGRYVISGAMPLTESGIPCAHGADCYIITSDAGDVVDGYSETFSSWFARGFYDSGLKELSGKCLTACGKIIGTGILKNRRTQAYVDFRNTPLLSPDVQGLDFYILPDSRPISSLHVILMCKYHVLNLYDYLRRTWTQDGKSKTRYALKYLVKSIRAEVKKQFGQNEDIIVFEHGSMNPTNGGGHSSIDHMHLHVILKREMDVQKLICGDAQKLRMERSQSVVQWDVAHKGPVPKRYYSINDFADDPEMGTTDYFLIWDLSIGKNYEKEAGKPVFVYLMQKLEQGSGLKIPDVHQYLRRIFFQALREKEQQTLYSDLMIQDYAKELGFKKFDIASVRRDIWRNDDKVIERGEEAREAYVKVGKGLVDAFNGGSTLRWEK